MDKNLDKTEVGYVLSIRDYLAFLDGLPSVKLNDIVENDQGIRGLINGLEPNRVEMLLLDEGMITPGQMFKTTGKKLEINLNPALLGRAISPLGIPIDGKRLLEPSQNWQELNQEPRGIRQRKFITNQFITGISAIDTLIPLGKGQRELVIGDSHSGINSFLMDLIINQKDSGVICIYACIGKPATFIKTLLDTLQINQALSYTVLVASSSTEESPLVFLTPKTAFTIAEYFQGQGKDVLVILDDLSIHAKIYREISLLAGKPPGRESYPGDIFSQHAHLLERAGNFNEDAGGGSITAIPVIETNLNDFTTFIPTNIMAITDGHLLFRSNLYNKGQRPAVDIFLSVSRVGRQTQSTVQSLLSRRIRQILTQASGLETVSRFSSELPAETQIIIKQRSLIEEIIRQESLIYIDIRTQLVLLGLVFTSFITNKNFSFFKQNKQKIINNFNQNPKLNFIMRAIPNMKTDDELIKALEEVVPVLNQIFSIDDKGINQP